MAKDQRQGIAQPTWRILNPGRRGCDPAFCYSDHDPEGAKALWQGKASLRPSAQHGLHWLLIVGYGRGDSLSLALRHPAWRRS